LTLSGQRLEKWRKVYWKRRSTTDYSDCGGQGGGGEGGEGEMELQYTLIQV